MFKICKLGIYCTIYSHQNIKIRLLILLNSANKIIFVKTIKKIETSEIIMYRTFWHGIRH